MTTTPRTIAAVALAAGTFGGTIGALATAAVQSTASPGAIAAAVQRVQDQKADNTLQSINSKLGTVNTKLGTVNTNLATLHADLTYTSGATSSLSILNNNLVDLAHGLGIGAPGGLLFGVSGYLRDICSIEAPSGFTAISCSALG